MARRQASNVYMLIYSCSIGHVVSKLSSCLYVIIKPHFCHVMDHSSRYRQFTNFRINLRQLQETIWKYQQYRRCLAFAYQPPPLNHVFWAYIILCANVRKEYFIAYGCYMYILLNTALYIIYLLLLAHARLTLNSYLLLKLVSNASNLTN